jgi:hypothetical protein
VNLVHREDWGRPLASVETAQVPVRRARRVFYLTGTVLFGGWLGYLFVAGGDEQLTEYARVGFHIGVAGLAVYAFGAVRLYYGILTGRSRLTIGRLGVSLGEHRIDWADIQDITLRPTSPVLRYLAFGPPSVRIQAQHRLRHIDVTRDHVKNLEAFAGWLRSTRDARIRSQPPS